MNHNTSLRMPQISVIMPAYNASKYISDAIESIIAQTFKEWELIIADDYSTDDTVSIIEEYCKKHNNIRLIKREINSGGARLPRSDAANAATASLIMTFDADDFLKKDYLEKMLRRKLETNANIVLSTLCLCDHNGIPNGNIIPKEDFDLSTITTGKEATKLLLGHVSISVSGLLIDKDLYIKNITTSNTNEDYYSYVDEIDQRRLLFNCNTVAYADTTYYYRQHPESLMHQTSIKRYDILETLRAIYEFATKHYTDNEIFQRLDKEYINNLLYCFRDYYYYRHDKTLNSHKIANIIKSSFEYMKEKRMSPSGIKQKICTQSYCVLGLISFIYAKTLKYKGL